MFEFFLAQNKPSITLSSLPYDILLRILSEFSPPQWVTDHRERGRWPQNSAMAYNRRLEEDSVAHLSAKRALSLVSWQFNNLTKRLLYEYIAVLTIKQLRSLHRVIRQQPTVAVNLARYTKRLDIVPTGEPAQRELHVGVRLGGHTRVEPLYICAMRIWEACPRITHLTVSIMYEPLPDAKFLTSSIRNRFPELKVFSWRYGPVIDHLDLFPDFAPKLRVLDLSKTCCLRYAEERPDEIPQLLFPHLHTLRGPINAICRDFSESQLPALRTFIAEHDDKDNFSPCNVDAFFSKHGPSIKQLTSRARGIGIKLEHLTNLCSLTFRIGDDILSKPEERHYTTSLEYVGLLDYSDSGHDASSSEVYETLREKVESTNKQILAAKQVDFPNIRTVQILTQISKLETWRLQTAWDFENSGIRFLDHAGKEISLTKSATTKSPSKPSKTKNAQTKRASPRVRRHTPKFAKERPGPNLSEIKAKLDSENVEIITEDTLSKAFNFNLNL